MGRISLQFETFRLWTFGLPNTAMFTRYWTSFRLLTSKFDPTFRAQKHVQQWHFRSILAELTNQFNLVQLFFHLPRLRALLDEILMASLLSYHPPFIYGFAVLNGEVT